MWTIFLSNGTDESERLKNPLQRKQKSLRVSSFFFFFPAIAFNNKLINKSRFFYGGRRIIKLMALWDASLCVPLNFFSSPSHQAFFFFSSQGINLTNDKWIRQIFKHTQTFPPQMIPNAYKSDEIIRQFITIKTRFRWYKLV
jgi:hypothetical protein